MYAIVDSNTGRALNVGHLRPFGSKGLDTSPLVFLDRQDAFTELVMAARTQRLPVEEVLLQFEIVRVYGVPERRVR